MPAPLVSVALVTYNHELFIRQALESVLEQTLSDIEVVIVDDGSTDETRAAVAEFHDRRVRYIYQKNQGPTVATNLAIAECRGNFVALCSGDDICEPRRLEAQLAAQYASGAVIFSNVSYIDDGGNSLDEMHFPKDFFLIPPMSQSEIIHRFFNAGNFIHTCTTFAKRELLRQIGPMQPCLWQLGDFEHLLRMVARSEFVFLTEPYYRWRYRPQQNLSTATPERTIRINNEHYLILRRFFNEIPTPLIIDAFSKDFRNPETRSRNELLCEMAFLYARPHMPAYAHLIAIEKLYSMLRDPTLKRTLMDKFNFGEKDFAKLATEIGIGYAPFVPGGLREA